MRALLFIVPIKSYITVRGLKVTMKQNKQHQLVKKYVLNNIHTVSILNGFNRYNLVMIAWVLLLVCVFLGSLLKCPISVFVFFQDGVDEGERHRPVAPQQTWIDRRAVDTFEHRLPTNSVSHRQHTPVLFHPFASGEAETFAWDAAPPAQDRG